MSKNKDELNEEILVLKELLKDKNTISSEYKSYSDHFEQRLESFEKNINKTFEEKLLAFKDNVHNPRLNYFNMLFCMAICWGMTWLFVSLITR